MLGKKPNPSCSTKNILTKPMLNVSIDYSLSPENCKEKGYEWTGDTIFDPEAPEIANKDVLALLQKGYKLGMPASRGASDIFVGLYKPVKQKS